MQFYNSEGECVVGLNNKERVLYSAEIELAQIREVDLIESVRKNDATKRRLTESAIKFRETIRELEGSLQNLNSVAKPIRDENNARVLRRKGKPKLRLAYLKSSSEDTDPHDY